MPKQISELEKSIGKLISVIQKEWGDQLGETHAAEFSENIMDSAHRLLQARSADNIKKLLGALTVKQYLGEVWVKGHPNVKDAIENVERALCNT